MKNKDEPEKKKNVRNSVVITANAIVSTKENVDVLKFVSENNDFVVEPKTDEGCVVTFKVTNVKLSKDKDNPDKNENLDRYMHFSFRKFNFVIDTQERTVQCSGAGAEHEMISDKLNNGMYLFNVETSN